MTRSISKNTLCSWLAITAAAAFMTACGGGGDNITDVEIPETPSTPAVKIPNVNANKATRPEYARLEMPRLHNGTDTVLVHKTTGGIVNYITEWDYKRKTQRWSCYVLDKDYLASNTSRSETEYPNDDLIPTSMQWTEDPYWFNGQKFDHGHMCPSADRLYSSEANKQTFYLTNMHPQFNAFNAGIWAKLEKMVRTIAATADTLYVCKGGTIDEGAWGGYNRIYRTLDNGLIVPRYFYMALLRVNKGTYSAIAIWTDQITNANDTGANMKQYAVSIDELETRTGIDFFCNLPDQTENTVEKTNSPGAWGLY